MAGMWGEINQALGNATNTAINIGQMQEQMRSRRAIEANDLERLNMDKQAFQQQQAMGDIALNKAKMEEAQMIKDKTVVPVEPFLLQRKVHPATIKAMIDDGLKAGYFNVGPGGAVTTEQGVGKQYLGVLEKDPEKNLRYETITAEAIHNDMDALKQQWQDPKLKPEQQEAISAKYAELSKQYSVHATSAQSIKAHILAKSNDKWEASFDPTAKKWVWRNAVTGEIDPNRNEVPQAAQIAASNAAEATKRAEAADASRVKAAGITAGGKQSVKLKPGERLTPSGDVEIIPGSSEYIKQSRLHGKDKTALNTVNTQTTEFTRKIDEVLNSPQFTKLFGGYNAYGTSLLPGETQNVKAKLKSIKSNLKKMGLEIMRSGGSIGQMTEREWPIVEQAISNIDPRMSEDEARSEFEKVKIYLNNLKTNANSVYQEGWGQTQFISDKGQKGEVPVNAPKTADDYLKKWGQ